jgi:hypothetical protein
MSSPLLEAVERELLTADRLNTTLGQVAVELARAMTDPLVSGSGAAALSKELRVVMAVVVNAGDRGDDLVDELRRGGDRKRGAPQVL